MLLEFRKKEMPIANSIAQIVEILQRADFSREKAKDLLNKVYLFLKKRYRVFPSKSKSLPPSINLMQACFAIAWWGLNQSVDSRVFR